MPSRRCLPVMLHRLLSPDEGDVVIGTYMGPRVLFFRGSVFNLTQDQALEVAATITGLPNEVLVTRMGGLLVRPPDELRARSGDPFPTADQHAQQVRFQEHVAELANIVMCGLALRHGIASAPAAPHDVASGRFVDGHALVHIGGDRMSEAVIALAQGPIITANAYSEEVLRDGDLVSWPLTLSEVAPTLPGFVVGAYSNLMLHAHAQACLTGFVVIEQLVDDLWRRRISEFSRRRRDRLADNRTYSAAVRIEILESVGVLATDLAELLHEARQIRSNVAHRAEVGDREARAVFHAMVSMLEARLGESL